MKYMLIIYGNQELWNSFGPDGMAEGVRGVRRLQQEVLRHRGTARRVRRGGRGGDQAGPVTRRAAGRDRRAVPGDQGVPGQLVPARRGQRAAGARDRRRTAVGRDQPTEVWPILHEASRETGADMGAADRHGQRRERRGPAARTRAAGPRRAHAPLRRPGQLRGRRAGGAARRRDAVAGARGRRGTRAAGCSRSRPGGSPTCCAASQRGGGARTRCSRHAARELAAGADAGYRPRVTSPRRATTPSPCCSCAATRRCARRRRSRSPCGPSAG